MDTRGGPFLTRGEVNVVVVCEDGNASHEKSGIARFMSVGAGRGLAAVTPLKPAGVKLISWIHEQP
jgi:hypothetical protein